MRFEEYARLTEEIRPSLPSYRAAVITVHGMNTRGAWQKVISPVIQDSLVRHIPIDYGTVRSRVLFPWTQKRIVREIQEAHQDHWEKGWTEISVIAHSLGSLAVGRTLQTAPDLNFSRAVLFGSILPRDFPWEGFISSGQLEAILNETCPRDPWPRRARPWIRGAGPSGCCGFTSTHPDVHQRAYGWTEHSEIATRVHCREAWVPFIVTGTVPSEKPTSSCNRRWLKCPAGLK
jgi:pimeloyl-ACP methyl ester carboxylesterase